jgi:type I restriction enzyme S subunit
LGGCSLEQNNLPQTGDTFFFLHKDRDITQEPLEEIENSTFGTTVKHLSHGDIENIELALPSLEEQQSIATILTDMDAETEALQARRAKTQAIKQGMMQELLTGRTRLV